MCIFSSEIAKNIALSKFWMIEKVVRLKMKSLEVLVLF